jgi:hypothetical protein
MGGVGGEEGRRVSGAWKAPDPSWDGEGANQGGTVAVSPSAIRPLVSPVPRGLGKRLDRRGHWPARPY